MNDTMLRLDAAALQSNIEGVWSDACPCKAPCPCWKTGRASSKRCVNVQIFHIQRGKFEGHNLGGLTFVLAGLPDVEYGTPDFYKVYSEPLGDVSVTSLFARVFQLLPVRGVQVVPTIRAKLSDSAHSVTIPTILTYKVGNTDRKASPPLSTDVGDYLYSWLRNPKQWTTRVFEYEEQGVVTKYSGTNSLVASFKISFEDGFPVARNGLNSSPKLSRNREMINHRAQLSTGKTAICDAPPRFPGGSGSSDASSAAKTGGVETE